MRELRRKRRIEWPLSSKKSAWKTGRLGGGLMKRESPAGLYNANLSSPLKGRRKKGRHSEVLKGTGATGETRSAQPN